MLKKIRAVFILLRPYSLPGLFLLYYLAKVIITNSLNLNLLNILMFVPVFFAWTFLTLFLEAQHKHSNREKIPYSYPITALLITILFAIFFNGLTPLLPLVFFLIFTYLYTKKNSTRFSGNTSFIMRGFMETSLFFFALSLFSNSYLNIQIIFLGIAILLITSARNLLGDIRDTKFDETTFSVSFGDGLSYIVSTVLYIFGGFVLFFISNYSIGIIFPLILMVILLLFIDNGYMFHRLSVLLSTVLISMYILFLTGNNSLIILLNVIFLSILFNLVFYDLVPRHANPKGINTKFGILPSLKKINSTKK